MDGVSPSLWQGLGTAVWTVRTGLVGLGFVGRGRGLVGRGRGLVGRGLGFGLVGANLRSTCSTVEMGIPREEPRQLQNEERIV